MTKLWLINYECAHWCGGSSNVVVHADTAHEAECKASIHMEESMRELYYDEYHDGDFDDESGNAYDDESAYTMNSTEEFDEAHDEWVFFKDPSQAEFYPVIQ